MAPLFFYGTLCHAPLLALVLGRAPQIAAAELSGYDVRWAAGQPFPMIREAAAGQVTGILFQDVTEADRARLNHYEGAFSYQLIPVTVETANGPQTAEMYLPEAGRWPAGRAWSLAEWERDWAALTLEAAAEVMAHFGRPEAADLDRRFGMIRARAQSRIRAAAWRRPDTLGVGYGRDAIEVQSFAQPYLGFFTLEEYQARHRLFDGTWGAPVERAVFRASDAVTVLPYDPVADTVLLIEQVRLGAFAHGDAAPWLLEPIAGIVDAGESYEATARREAAEEAGVQITALHQIGRYYPSPGGVAQVLISYLGLADLTGARPASGGIDSEGEDIRSHLLSFERAMGLVTSGEIAVGPLILSLQWLALNRDRLRRG